MWWDTSLYYKGLRQARPPSRGGTKVRGIEKNIRVSPSGKTSVEVMGTPRQVKKDLSNPSSVQCYGVQTKYLFALLT